jgi:integrase
MKQPILTLEKKRIKGKWATYHVIRWYDDHGKRRSKSLGNTNTLSKTLARKALREFKQKYDSDPAFRRDTRCTITQVWEAFENIRKHELAPTTLTRYHGAAKHLCKHFGPNYPVERLTESGVAQFKASMIQGELAKRSINAQSANGNMRSLKAIFNFAMNKLKIIPAHPFKGMVESIKQSQDWHYARVADLDPIMATSPSLGLLFALCRLAGLRKMEAVTLEWVNVDFEQSRLTVVGKSDDAGWQPKSRQTRVVPIFPELMALLTQAFNEAPEGQQRVCTGLRTKHNLSYDLPRVIRQAGLEPYSKPLHSLRKSCLTDWAKVFPMHCVQQWAGHADISTTQKFYLKVDDDMYTRAANSNLWSSGTENRTERSDIEKVNKT